MPVDDNTDRGRKVPKHYKYSRDLEGFKNLQGLVNLSYSKISLVILYSTAAWLNN